MFVVPFVLFLGALVRSTFGFGEALVSVPLLALLIPVKLAVPLAVLVSITVAGIVVIQDWKKIHLRTAGWLIFSSLFGIPLGLWVLKAAPEAAVKASLAVVIVAFSIYSIMKGRQHELKDDHFAWLFGFSAGILGGAYGMNGPPLAIFGALRRWPPAYFRATLQGYFFPASIVVMFGYWSTGLWTAAVNRYYLLSLPGIVLAIVIGRVVNQRLHPQRFHRYVFVALAVIGAVLLLETLRT